MNRRWSGMLMLALAVTVGGCAAPPRAGAAINRMALKRRAMDCLSAAVRYRANPAVRAQAVEALESSGLRQARPWIRAALVDDSAAVRFASCVALGRLQDAEAAEALAERVSDRDASVQVAALFALHRLGIRDRTGRIPTYLLADQDVTVRRNAALLLGLLGERSAIAPLARAVRDRDRGVRQHALEAMARLGNPEARQELTFMANAGIGPEEVFAIGALAATGERRYVEPLRYKLASAAHVETRLAAAGGLARLGQDDGWELAVRALRAKRIPASGSQEPAAERSLRVRQLAAVALGAIGRAEALGDLADLMEQDDDPRLQVSAARAILEILAADRARALPFMATKDRG